MTDAHEKAWMDETVAEELLEDELFGTQIVCRTGTPSPSPTCAKSLRATRGRS